jgi:F-type H+-transporting ATPase subunit epsilon
MAETFELELATPERLVLREQVSEAQIPAQNGFIGVLPGHAPLLTELATGYLSYKVHGKTHFMALNSGFMEVMPEKVRILADTAEKAVEIDVKRAEEALRRSQQRISNPALGIDVARALYSMQRAQARLEAARLGR